MTPGDQILFVVDLQQVLATQLGRKEQEVDIMIKNRVTHDPCFKYYPMYDSVVEHIDQEYHNLPPGTKHYSAVLVVKSKAEPLYIRPQDEGHHDQVAYCPLQDGEIIIFDGQRSHWTAKAQDNRHIIALQFAVVPPGQTAPLATLLSNVWRCCDCGQPNPRLVKTCWECLKSEEDEDEDEEDEEEEDDEEEDEEDEEEEEKEEKEEEKEEEEEEQQQQEEEEEQEEGQEQEHYFQSYLTIIERRQTR
jgi:hypothetical protein